MRQSPSIEAEAKKLNPMKHKFHFGYLYLTESRPQQELVQHAPRSPRSYIVDSSEHSLAPI
ncbi:hypothetical protein CNECB9_1350011 [Cupriavidus necator]|uniref:Uncharacterized protein n=1 Tax=Cupriavidus necator TaxID=106590 RepID=A0A1K0I9N3_CUPNE|nr:hypothetical protein CNECB9_1350011 [Cupriavidus necator]